jgi:predicted MPP superfamily phosphohydrolase
MMSVADVGEFLRELSLLVPSWLLLTAACVGHGYLMIVGLNILYAWPMPHQLLKVTRKLDLLIIMAGPIVFGFALDLGGMSRLGWDAEGVRAYLAPYVFACALAGVTIAPLGEILYLLRRTAPQLTAETGTVVDVAAALGYQPRGKVKQAPLCGLPGNEVFQVEFNEKTLLLPQLPAAWDGLSILHLTDLHLCGTPDRAFYQYVIERALEGDTPDLVAVTGDIVDSDWHHRWVVPILGRLRCKTAGFAILGNHDSWRDYTLVRRRLRRSGLRVLGNSWEQLEVRGVPLVVIGHEGPWFRPAPKLDACPTEPFRLCLSHTPDNFPWARRHAIDLVLAGHVHGGQIRVPLLGSVFVPSRFSRRYDCGTFFASPTVMHVGRGLGGQHPLRYFCRPEVTRLILKKGIALPATQSAPGRVVSSV